MDKRSNDRAHGAHDFGALSRQLARGRDQAKPLVRLPTADMAGAALRELFISVSASDETRTLQER